MSIKTNFYDGQSYLPQDMINPWKSLLDDGVFNVSSGALAPSANSPANLSANIAAGAAIKNGYYIKSDAAVNIPITSNTSGYNRIDIIVLEVDPDNKVTSIKAVQGAPSSSPTAPLPTANQLKIAEVSVGNNVSVINTENITDKRINVDLFGSQLAAFMNYCYARSSVDINLPNATYVDIPLNTNMNDPQNMHSITVNNTRITIPKSGNYAIVGIVVFAADTTGRREIQIRLNGGEYIAGTAAPATNTNQGIIASTIRYLNAGDYIELMALQSSTKSLKALTFYNYAPSLSVQRIGG